MTKHSVLIVEDERIVQMHLRQIVAGLGHEVVGTAVSTSEAMDVSERTPPDLVLMDIHLAGGSDGVEAARLLSERWNCAVVFLTAYADPETIERSSPVGAAGYLVKPFTPEQVGAAIATAFASRDRDRRAKRADRSLASALVSLGEAVFVTDEHGTITFANPRASELTGWPASEACGRPLLEVVRPATEEDRRQLESTVGKVWAEGSAESLPPMEIRSRDGSEAAVEIGIERVRNGGDTPAGLIALLRRRDRRRTSATRVPRDAGRRPFGEGTRLLMYSHDTLGLGHLRRSLILLRALCARHPGLSALLVTGSPMAHRYPLPPGSDYVKLPAIRKTSAERYEARSLPLPGENIRTLRSNLILRTVRDYEPDVLLADHSPAGSGSELLPALEWLAERGGCTRILGLRDIIDDPAAVRESWRASGIPRVMEELYDHVVVYGSRTVYDTVEAYGFSPTVAAKTRYVHYVCDRAEDAGSGDLPGGGRPRVTVSIGGGDGGGDTLVGPFLEMMQARRGEIDFQAEILTGPLLPPALERLFQDLARDLPVTVTSFVPSVAPRYRTSELVVSTAGYNTVVDQMAHSRRAILVPRVLYRQEQRIRAQRMDELGLATYLAPEEVTADSLFAAIESARRDPGTALADARERGEVPLDGAERFAEFCSGIPVGGA